MLRRLLIVLAVVLVAGVFGRPALASYNHNLTSAHFQVWYDSDPKQPDYATQPQASQVAAYAEHALQVYESWGYDAPVTDPSGKLQIGIDDLSADGNPTYEWQWGAETAPTYVNFFLGVTELASAREAADVENAVFMMISGRYWVPSGYRNSGTDGSEDWLLSGPSEWAAFKLEDYASPAQIGPPELSLTCHDYDFKLEQCSKDGYINDGESKWPFYELLAQRYGPLFMRMVWQDANAAGNAVTGLSNAIASQGGTLADAFNDFAVRQIAGGWGIPPLDALTPQVTGSPVSTGATTGAIPSTTVNVDHLATRIVEYTRGDGDGSHPCFAATLTLDVAIPAGTNSRPYFTWTGGATPATLALAVSGSTATATIPWDTCTWAKGVGYLVVPNDSTNVDAAPFVVTGTLTVDQTTPATPGIAPTPTTVTGPVVSVPNADVPPAIDVMSPLLLHISASAPTLRLIVYSNAEGKLHVTLGAGDLGTFALRPGGNDLRLSLPKSLRSALRRSSSAGNLLTLTPVSSSGAATGAAVTRQVVVTPTAPSKKPVKKQKH